MKLTIPFYLHKVGAGFPSPATDYIEDDIDLNSHLITNAPATFIIRVQGKSMVNVGIYDGDLLIVDKSIDPKNFSTVIANVNEELVVKNLVKERGVSYLTSGSKDISNNDVKACFGNNCVTYRKIESPDIRRKIRRQKRKLENLQEQLKDARAAKRSRNKISHER